MENKPRSLGRSALYTVIDKRVKSLDSLARTRAENRLGETLNEKGHFTLPECEKTKTPTVRINESPHPAGVAFRGGASARMASGRAENRLGALGERLLRGRFQLLRLLGAGGMGNVYLAKDILREEMEDSAPFVAIKILNDRCRKLPGALQALAREAKKAQALSHPNIVTVYDFDRDADTAFITMEYIEGSELKERLRKKGRLDPSEVMFIIERVARGLAYAHQQGFAHSDIKPANIFLSKDGTVKILDFGIARAFKKAAMEKRSLADELTERALTPRYASVQMLEGQSPNASDDVFALAAMAYEMLAGQHPFLAADGTPLPAHLAKNQTLKVKVLEQVPKRFMRAIIRGLAYERQDRYADAGLFIDAIKLRNFKKDLTLLATAALLTGVLMFSARHGLEQVVPAINSLKPELGSVVALIKEGDGFVKAGQVDTAHRLYSQAWELANHLTAEDVRERKKTQTILRDRMGKVANFLIDASRDGDIGEYRLRELRIALQFLLEDEITDNDKAIRSALADISRQLERL